MATEKLAKPVIVCAANRIGDLVICGPRHWDTTMRKVAVALRMSFEIADYQTAEQGFVDQFGNFHDRKAAARIAVSAGQVKRWSGEPQILYSEDLY